jgi:CO dehydrogenase maturation factor
MVDKLIVVVEPGRRSIETAVNIRQLAADIGIKKLAVVGNKVRKQSDREFLISTLSDFDFLGFIPYDQAVVDADLANQSPLEASQKVKDAVQEIYEALVTDSKASVN